VSARGRAGRLAGLAGVVAVLYLLLTAGALAEVVALVAVASLALHVAERALRRSLVTVVPRRLGVVPAEINTRLLLQQALVLVYLLRSGELSAGAEVTVVAAVVLHTGLRAVFAAGELLDDETRRGTAQARGLDVEGGPVPPRPALLGEKGHDLVVHAAALPALAVLWAAVSGSHALVAPAAVLMVVLALAVALAVAPHLAVVARLPRGARRWRLVNAAVQRHAPLVVLHSSGGVNSVHQITMWLDTLDEMRRPTLVMLRDPDVFAGLRPTTTPVVLLPHPDQVTAFEMPSARVALYVANGAENLRLLRNTALRSAFIGHGDSDKASSANPFSRVYDEVWVAGEAGRQRYLDADVGVRPEAIRIVGRPQTSRIRRVSPRPPGEPWTVVYAPTWEGLYGDPYESSLLHSGREIVRALLATEGVRVVYRPHPGTGRTAPEMGRVSQEIAQMVRDAGPEHRALIGTGVDLAGLFNEADALVADVSGVVSDFIASGKPYFVVNGRGLTDNEFRERFPSARGAYLVGPGGSGLLEGLLDARGADSVRERREATRLYLLGPPTDDPVEMFAQAVDALAALPTSGAPTPVADRA
jgi:hypothetical protein